VVFSVPFLLVVPRRQPREMVHLPDKPAGVDESGRLKLLGTEFLQLPDKPAGARRVAASALTEMHFIPAKPAAMSMCYGINDPPPRFPVPTNKRGA
jgi:hypothetical protein